MIAIYLIVALICGVIGKSISEGKGREASAGFGLGFLLGPIGILIAAVLPTDHRGLEQQRVRQGLAKKCPDCAETVADEARKCKHCGHIFDADGERESNRDDDFARAIPTRRATRL